MNLGQRIKEARESIGLTQTEFSKKIGISKQTLYKYENGIITNIPSNIIEIIAKAANWSPAYIMGWTTSKEIIEGADTLEQLAELQKLMEKRIEYDNLEFSVIDKAMNLYKQYQNAIPQVQSAVDALLRPQQPDT